MSFSALEVILSAPDFDKAAQFSHQCLTGGAHPPPPYRQSPSTRPVRCPTTQGGGMTNRPAVANIAAESLGSDPLVDRDGQQMCWSRRVPLVLPGPKSPMAPELLATS